jgi:hypothetical protein
MDGADMALGSWWWVIVAIVAIVAVWMMGTFYWTESPRNELPAPVTVPAEPAVPPVVN